MLTVPRHIFFFVVIDAARCLAVILRGKEEMAAGVVCSLPISFVFNGETSKIRKCSSFTVPLSLRHCHRSRSLIPLSFKQHRRCSVVACLPSQSSPSTSFSDYDSPSRKKLFVSGQLFSSFLSYLIQITV